MMSDEAARHYSRYMENVALATDIDQLLATHRGWNCVVRFYAVLHLINAYLIGKANLRFNPGSTEHKERTQAMASCPELRDVPQKYRNMKNLSEAVRYDVNYVFTEEDEEKSVAWLAKIVAVVEPKLKKA